MMRKMFAGGNSGRGFYSLFDQMFGEHIEEIFLLKGGPGTGKSTLMRAIAQFALDNGYPVELFYCASDPDSLDGVVLPLQRAGVVDATAPHVQDPFLPGCREEIINLGENWDRSVLIQSKSEISSLTVANKAAYARAYRFLRAAEEMEELWAAINEKYIDKTELNSIVNMIIAELPFKGRYEIDLSSIGERHLFASAITPSGYVSHIESLVRDYQRRYILRCAPGVGSDLIFSSLIDAARLGGYYIEVFHRPLIPSNIEHVLVPELGMAVVSDTDPLGVDLQGTIIDLTVNIKKEAVPQKVKDLYGELLNEGVAQLREAKAVHDELERYYVNAIDFNGVEAVGSMLHSRIFSS